MLPDVGALTGTHCSVVPHWPGWNFLRAALHSQVPPALTAFFSFHRCQTHTTASPFPLLISLLLCIDVFPNMSLVLLISFWQLLSGQLKSISVFRCKSAHYLPLSHSMPFFKGKTCYCFKFSSRVLYSYTINYISPFAFPLILYFFASSFSFSTRLIAPSTYCPACYFFT